VYLFYLRVTSTMHPSVALANVCCITVSLHQLPCLKMAYDRWKSTGSLPVNIFFTPHGMKGTGCTGRLMHLDNVGLWQWANTVI
jgi:hypothetical protein